MGQSVWFVLGLATSAVCFILLVFGINALVSPRKPSDEKGTSYECGMEPASKPWNAVDIRFSSVAVLLVIFDAEAALLFAVAVGVRGSWLGAVEVGIFAAFLALGLAYAWRKGALEWRS